MKKSPHHLPVLSFYIKHTLIFFFFTAPVRNKVLADFQLYVGSKRSDYKVPDFVIKSHPEAMQFLRWNPVQTDELLRSYILHQAISARLSSLHSSGQAGLEKYAQMLSTW